METKKCTVKNGNNTGVQKDRRLLLQRTGGLKKKGYRTDTRRGRTTVHRKKQNRREDPQGGTYLQDGGYKEELILRDWRNKDFRSRSTEQYIPIPVNKENKRSINNEGGIPKRVN